MLIVTIRKSNCQHLIGLRCNNCTIMHEMRQRERKKKIFFMLPATQSFTSMVRIPGQSGPPLPLYGSDDRATTALDTAVNHINVLLCKSSRNVTHIFDQF